MSIEHLFDLQLVAGYAAWLLAFGAYIWPWLRRRSRVDAQRAIATLHSFRIFGLIFIIPGVVSPDLPPGFGPFAAWMDYGAGVLAMLALATVRVKPLFWLFVIAFNIVGIVDLVMDYVHAIQLGVPSNAGLFQSGYWVPVLYVPILMITHLTAFWLLVSPKRGSAKAVAAG